MLGGRYRVENELGRGGMAKVYRGEDTVLGRTVAVKVLAPQYADDPNFVTRFRREAQAAARLSNQHLVSVFDTGSDDGVHFIVMEYVEGRTLADYLSGGGRIMPERAIDIAIDVCRALEAAHAQGVVHRDIKPGNIMLTPRGDVKVTDFGIARVVTTAETVAQTAAVLGTASYLSPEQAQGQPVDARSDLYSLGCVLYEMVGGRPPFTGDSPVAVASKQVLETPTPPSKLNPDVSPDLEAVILRAMAKNPANRYQSAEELRQDLERVRRGLPVDAPQVLAVPTVPAAPTTQVLHHEPAPSRTAVLPPTATVEPEPEGTKWWIPVLITLLVLGILALVLFLLARNLLEDDEPQQPTLVPVPNVVNERLRSAEETLEAEGFVVDVVRVAAEEFPEVEPGIVVEQTPEAGTEVEPESTVTLTVVEAPDAVLVPTVTPGTSVEEAQAALLEVGLVPGEIVPQPSDEIEVDQVIATDPAGGTEVEPESTVDIIVSSGPETVVVENVVCLSFNAAQNRLRAQGLNPIISSSTVPVNPQCPFGNKVAQQDPPAGSEVDPGAGVSLFPGAEPEPTGPTGATGGT